jgi:hypothetical protein
MKNQNPTPHTKKMKKSTPQCQKYIPYYDTPQTDSVKKTFPKTDEKNLHIFKEKIFYNKFYNIQNMKIIYKILASNPNNSIKLHLKSIIRHQN